MLLQISQDHNTYVHCCCYSVPGKQRTHQFISAVEWSILSHKKKQNKKHQEAKSSPSARRNIRAVTGHILPRTHLRKGTSFSSFQTPYSFKKNESLVRSEVELFPPFPSPPLSLENDITQENSLIRRQLSVIIKFQNFQQCTQQLQHGKRVDASYHVQLLLQRVTGCFTECSTSSDFFLSRSAIIRRNGE